MNGLRDTLLPSYIMKPNIMEHSWRYPLMLWLRRQDELGQFYASVIGPSPDITNEPPPMVVSDDVYLILPELKVFARDDRHMIKTPISSHDGSHVLPAMNIGDCILAADGVGRLANNDQNAVQLVSAVKVLGQAADETDVFALAAAVPPKDNGIVGFSFMTQLDLEFHINADRARREPNEALVFAWSGAGGRIENQILQTKGAYLFFEFGLNENDCEGCGLPEPAAPGLWLFKNGTYYSSRDFESGHIDEYGLDGDFEALSIEQAATYADRPIEALVVELEEIYPYILEKPILEAIVLPEGSSETDPPTREPFFLR